MAGDAFFRTVLDGLPAAVHVTDSKGIITNFNEAAATLWGHRPTLGEGWRDGTSLPRGDCPIALSLLESRPIRSMEAVAERADGVRVPLSLSPPRCTTIQARLPARSIC